MIPETLLPKFVHLKFWLAGLLTRQTIVAFPAPIYQEKWRVLQLIQNDLQLRAQYRHLTGFPLSEKIATNWWQMYMLKWKTEDKSWQKSGFWIVDDTGYWNGEMDRDRLRLLEIVRDC